MLERVWQKKLNDNPVPWLLESDARTKYRTMIDMLELPADDEGVMQARQEMLHDEKTSALLAATADWFPQSFTRHNDAKLTHYKLRMLADFGLTVQDAGISNIVAKATAHKDSGLYAIRQELPKKGEGFSKPNPESDEWHAVPCDSPILTYTLKQLGYASDHLENAIDMIKKKWLDSQGWFCHFFFVDGMHKKLQVGCPMAGLQALELFSLVPELKESDCAKNAYEPIRFHHEYGKSVYYFGRSKKFWTMKYPFVWYNALYLADVLTRFESLKDELLIKELIDWILESQDEQGRFKPTSMFMLYKGWDFANKKEPSPWITLLCSRILKRYFSE